MGLAGHHRDLGNVHSGRLSWICSLVQKNIGRKSKVEVVRQNAGYMKETMDGPVLLTAVSSVVGRHAHRKSM